MIKIKQILDLTTELGNKATKTELTDGLALKVDKTTLTTELAKKSDKDDTYTKTEVNGLISGIPEPDLSNLATKTELTDGLALKVDKTTLTTELAKKADKDDTYTKTEVDDKINLKADKTFVDSELAKKADKDSVYIKTETYNKTEVDNKIVEDNTVKVIDKAVADITLNETLIHGKIYAFNVSNVAGISGKLTFGTNAKVPFNTSVSIMLTKDSSVTGNLTLNMEGLTTANYTKGVVLNDGVTSIFGDGGVALLTNIGGRLYVRVNNGL